MSEQEAPTQETPLPADELEQLADRVYELLLQDARLERERQGPP